MDSNHRIQTNKTLPTQGRYNNYNAFITYTVALSHLCQPSRDLL